MGGSWLAVPKDWLASMGEIVRFCSRIVAEVFTLKVFRFFGEGLRQAGLLILSSTLVIWGREDALVSSAYAEEFGDRIAGARVAVLDACGHVPQVEQRDETLRLVREFLG